MIGKKAIMSMITVLFILLALGVIFVNDSSISRVIASIGHNQNLILKSYTEGEKAHEYLNQAARFALLEAAADAGAKPGTDCFSSVTDLDAKFREKIKKYTDVDLSVTPGLKVTLPTMTWEIKSRTSKSATLHGYSAPASADYWILATSEYGQSAMPAEVGFPAVTCDDYERFIDARGTAAQVIK
ncbi:MAG: hypothetical protein V1839_00430 [archaeon]